MKNYKDLVNEALNPQQRMKRSIIARRTAKMRNVTRQRNREDDAPIDAIYSQRRGRQAEKSTKTEVNALTIAWFGLQLYV